MAKADDEITAALYKYQRDARREREAERARQLARRAARFPGETEKQRFSRMPKVGDRVKLYDHPGMATVYEHDGFNIRVMLDEGTIDGSRTPWVTHLDVES